MTGGVEGAGRGHVKNGTQMEFDFRYLTNVQKALVWKLEAQIQKSSA